MGKPESIPAKAPAAPRSLKPRPKAAPRDRRTTSVSHIIDWGKITGWLIIGIITIIAMLIGFDDRVIAFVAAVARRLAL
jgi:hypothetical protein